LNLAGVLVSMGMEMEKEKRGHPLGWWIVWWMDGWMDAWLGCAIPLGCFWLELCRAWARFTFCDERGGHERCRFWAVRF
jgi:hypothetical protein